MGLIKAIVGAAGGALADSWREYFYCDAIDENTLAVKGQKRTSGRSSNTRAEDNIISNGSVIAVADGQCMIIVEQGEIVDVCAEPGEFTYDRSTEPSLFYGNLGETIGQTFNQIGRRFTFGGDTGKDQRVYYFNTKEIYGNKYGTTSPIPMRIVDARLGFEFEPGVRMNGEYSYRLVDPLLFYKNVCGNVDAPYTRDRLESQMRSELLMALQPALARISEMGVRYSAIPAHTKELGQILNEELSADWSQRRGIKIESFGINSITMSEEDEERLKNLQMAAPLSNMNMAAGYTAAAAGDAMRDAANNPNGAMNAFMGMGMANGMGTGAAAQMFAQGGGYQAPPVSGAAADGGYGAQPFAGYQPQGAPTAPAGTTPPANAPVPPTPATPPQGAAPAAAPAAPQDEAVHGAHAAHEAPASAAAAPADGSWVCPTCGNTNATNFCSNCGTQKPAPAEWTCPDCGTVNDSKFCGNCGHPRP